MADVTWDRSGGKGKEVREAARPGKKFYFFPKTHGIQGRGSNLIKSTFSTFPQAPAGYCLQ